MDALLLLNQEDIDAACAAIDPLTLRYLSIDNPEGSSTTYLNSNVLSPPHSDDATASLHSSFDSTFSEEDKPKKKTRRGCRGSGKTRKLAKASTAAAENTPTFANQDIPHHRHAAGSNYPHDLQHLVSFPGPRNHAITGMQSSHPVLNPFAAAKDRNMAAVLLPPHARAY